MRRKGAFGSAPLFAWQRGRAELSAQPRLSLASLAAIQSTAQCPVASWSRDPCASRVSNVPRAHSSGAQAVLVSPHTHTSPRL